MGLIINIIEYLLWKMMGQKEKKSACFINLLMSSLINLPRNLQHTKILSFSNVQICSLTYVVANLRTDSIIDPHNLYEKQHPM